jgi:hypothetical protein
MRLSSLLPFIHVTVGIGFPSAKHSNVTESSIVALTSSLIATILGGFLDVSTNVKVTEDRILYKNKHVLLLLVRGLSWS